MNRAVFFSPMLLAVALSPAFLYSSCNKTGNPNLVSLELEAGGINRIVGFDTAVTGYNVWLDGATTMTVRGESVDPGSRISWEMADGSFGEIGYGTGELTFDPALPDGTALFINVTAPGGRARQFALTINPPCTGSECDDNNSCSSDVCNASVCEFTTEPDGTPCTDADGGQDQCVAGVCPSNALTKSFSMGCIQNVFFDWWPATWTLTIDPLTPVVAGQPFDVAISGEVSIETTLDALAAYAQFTYPRLYGFGSVPVLVRSGATGSATANVSESGGPHVCTLDGAPCDPANNVSGMFSGNSDCSGAGSDYCLPYAYPTVIDDTGNACASCIAADEFDYYYSGSGTGLKQILCEAVAVPPDPTNVCTDSSPFALDPVIATFVADPGASEVLFGFEEGDPVAGMNPAAAWNDGVGVDTVQVASALSTPGGGYPFTIAGDCYMGVANYDGSTDPLTPLPDSALISIPVQPNPAFSHPCTEQGVLDATAAGGGPHTFTCSGPTTVTLSVPLNITTDVILDGEGNLEILGSVLVSGTAVVELRGVTVRGGGSTAVQSGLDTQLTIVDSTVEASNALTAGGSLTVIRSTITSLSEGGIGAYAIGPLTILDSLFRGVDVAGFTDAGTALSDLGAAAGATIANSTFVGNSPTDDALALSGSARLSHVTVDGDWFFADPAVVSNSVIYPLTGCSEFSAPPISEGYNTEVGGNTCGFTDPTDQVNVAPAALNLGPLQDNGGPTQTYLPGPGSVAIDAVPPAACLDADGLPLTTDQRGITRPQGTNCDIGAVEVEQP